jgi:alkylation response protein AidB-like acyl-CoA dehydrogenase
MSASSVSGPQAGTPMSVSDIYANARGLGAYLKEKSAEIDEARQLPPEVVARVREAGMFRLAMPKDWGGPELSTIEQVEVIEELSKANASVGWCVMIGCDSGFVVGWLDDRVARKLFPRLDMVTAGNFFPTGRADRVEGGYKINGRWPFGSGITHADLAVSTSIIFENGAPVMNASGIQDSRRMVAPASAYEVVDNWYTTGMRGTGSNDFCAADLFIPEEHSWNTLEPAKRENTLWRGPTTFIAKASGVPLGGARAMIDLVSETMQSKIETPGGRAYKDLARIQSTIADAEMILGAARSYVFSAIEREWNRLEHHEVPTEKERADVWLSRVNVAQSARRVIRMLYDAVGGSAIYAKKSPFDLALRDAETWCQHVVFQRRTLEWVGAMLLKSDARAPLGLL